MLHYAARAANGPAGRICREEEVPDHAMLIRHAEKPQPGGDDGVDASGKPDPHSLTPRGWQRAGAGAELFAPSLERAPALPKPTAIFASAPNPAAARSRRPLQTISLLAEK